jgi:hypothetical protein
MHDMVEEKSLKLAGEIKAAQSSKNITRTATRNLAKRGLADPRESDSPSPTYLLTSLPEDTGCLSDVL